MTIAVASEPNLSASSAAGTVTDPRGAFFRSLAIAARTVAAVRPEQLDLATPCRGWNVRTLLAHTLGAAERAIAAGRGAPLPDIDTDRPDIADDAWAGRFAALEADAAAAWADARRLETLIELPWASMPGANVVLIYAGEVTTHTWDLAHATGLAVAWDQSIPSAVLDFVRNMMPAEGRVEDIPFDDAVDVPADASAIERLVAWFGRRP